MYASLLLVLALYHLIPPGGWREASVVNQLFWREGVGGGGRNWPRGVPIVNSCGETSAVGLGWDVGGLGGAPKLKLQTLHSIWLWIDLIAVFFQKKVALRQ
jgi:hypothetical protein